MRKITLSEYNAIPEDYRGIWTVERWDLPDWADLREKHIGKRTMMAYDNGTCLLVEGMGFEIVDDSSWKKTDEVRQEIGCHYLKFYSGQGRDPHYADCVIRWRDTLETEEARIALAMDSDTEKDDEQFGRFEIVGGQRRGGFYRCRMPRFRDIRRTVANNLK